MGALESTSKRQTEHRKMSSSILFVLVAIAAVKGDCGVRYVGDDAASQSASKGYVVGGQWAEPGSLPWQISLHDKYGFFCGGTIIDSRWILTAAHCVYGTSTRGLFITAGENDFLNNEGTEQRIGVEKVFMHKNYNDLTTVNDITLLKLKSDLDFNKYVQPACLPQLANEDRDYASGNEAIISGWGSLGGRKGYPDKLQWATVPLISDATCKKRGVYHNMISKSMVCAGKLGVGGVDACQGDSGGPMV